MIVLDTDHVTLMQWGTGADAIRLRDRLARAVPEDPVTTIVTYEEQTRGWFKYLAGAHTLGQQVAAYGKLNRHLDNYRTMRVLGFDEQAAVEFQGLRKSRIRIGTKDLQIAAIVLAHGARLLSRNLKHFRKVPGLQVEDWTV